MPLVPPVTSATFPESFSDIVFSWLSLGVTTNLITSRSSGKTAINFETRIRDERGFRTGEIRDHASHLAVYSDQGQSSWSFLRQGLHLRDSYRCRSRLGRNVSHCRSTTALHTHPLTSMFHLY